LKTEEKYITEERRIPISVEGRKTWGIRRKVEKRRFEGRS